MANTVQKESKVVYLQIGQNYEHLAENKQFDVSEWVEAYPDATIYILFRRPGEDVVAPVQTTLEDGILTWTISNWETGIIGVGFAEIRAIDSATGLVKKSHVIPCSVEASVTDEDTAPDFPSWIDRMITMNEHLESVYADFNQELADGITAIQDEASEQKDDVVAAIQDKGDAVIASIPMSYTDLIEALAGATYNANRHYDHDEFVWYDNHLWRRRTDSPSIVGPWNEDDWVRAALTAHVTEALWQVESMQNELYNSIAPAWDYYDTTASYAVGDYVINRERLYRCISPVSGGGEFDYSKWEVVTVATELQKYVQSDVLASEYSASTTYKAGQYVWYSGNVYRCKTDISTAEAWTAAHWQLVKIGDELTSLKNIMNYLPKNVDSDAVDADLDITDPSGNVILRLADGHIQTKNFDSSRVSGDTRVMESDAEDVDLDFSDENGNVLLRLKDGHIKTIYFDSSDPMNQSIPTDAEDVDLDIADSYGNIIMRLQDGEVETKNFSSYEMSERVRNAEENINDLADAIGTGFSVPSYWATTIAEKELAINNLNNAIGSNGATFLFFTDYHQNSNNGKSLPLMLHVLNNTSVRDVFYGGDTSDGGSLPNTASAEAKLREVANHLKPLKMFAIRGNHDCEPSATVTTNQISESAYYDMYVRPIEKDIKGTGKPYFYVDNETAKVRYICMDSGSRLTDAMDTTQMSWMKSHLQELSNDWTVIIFQHMVYEKVNRPEQTIITMGQTLLNAIDDVFDSLNCTIAAVIAGHCHTDAIIPTDHNFKVITTTCDSGGANAASDPLYPTRTPGTTSEQAFDVFTVDKATRTIHITRIGAGVDRNTTY